MDYLQRPIYHYKPKKGWINDPNGLVYFRGYYHIFYQHSLDFEIPRHPIHWGHARTENFIDWEELPVALHPDKDYDAQGCWSGTSIVKDNVLYMFYTSISENEKQQNISIAYSTDGINFKKYENNPVIKAYPPDGGPDFRDPAVCCIDGQYYCIIATGHSESNTGRLLLYKSTDLFNWKYIGIMAEWENCKFAECPSFVKAENGKYLLTASVYRSEEDHHFSVMYGNFRENKFEIQFSAEVDKGPDLYAGQVFHDNFGRNILLSWFPGGGGKYIGFAEKDVGRISFPKELKLIDGEIYAYPLKELRHLLKNSDPAVKITENGFIIERNGRSPVVYNGKINDLKILRDGYMIEVFVNKGKEVYTALL